MPAIHVSLFADWLVELYMMAQWILDVTRLFLLDLRGILVWWRATPARRSRKLSSPDRIANLDIP